jgi:hypothetical protein
VQLIACVCEFHARLPADNDSAAISLPPKSGRAIDGLDLMSQICSTFVLFRSVAFRHHVSIAIQGRFVLRI